MPISINCNPDSFQLQYFLFDNDWQSFYDIYESFVWFLRHTDHACIKGTNCNVDSWLFTWSWLYDIYELFVWFLRHTDHACKKCDDSLWVQYQDPFSLVTATYLTWVYFIGVAVDTSDCCITMILTTVGVKRSLVLLSYLLELEDQGHFQLSPHY